MNLVVAVSAHSKVSLGSKFCFILPGRNGRYQLQSSRNIITPSALADSEEILNQGTVNVAEIFINLRSKSVLHLFASIGKFLGLQVIIFYDFSQNNS